MRRPSLITIALLPVLAALVSVTSNVATDAIPASVRPRPPWSWLLLAALVMVVVGAEVVASRRAGSQSSSPAYEDGRLLHAADRLARAVEDQWRVEAAVRLLNRPNPIKVRWSSTRRPVSAEPSAILGEMSGGARPTGLRLRGDVSKIVGLYEQLPAGHLVILGAPGAGKTVLALLLTLGLLGRRAAGGRVPLLVSLASWDPASLSLNAWLVQRIGEDYPGLENIDTYGMSAPDRLVAEGLVLPVLDGLDELPTELRSAAIERIDRAAAGGRGVVVTCRADDYENAVREGGQILTSAAVIEIEPVEPQDLIPFLAGMPSPIRERWSRVLDHLRAQPGQPLAEALSTPLMMWLARVAFGRPGTDPLTLLDRKAFPNRAAIEDHLLDAFVTAMYAVGNETAGQGWAARLDPVCARRWLCFVATLLEAPSRSRRAGPVARVATDFAWWQLYRALSLGERALGAALLGLTTAVLPVFVIVGTTVGLTPYRIAGLTSSLVFGLLAEIGVAVFLKPPPPGRIRAHVASLRQVLLVVRAGMTYSLTGAVTVGLAAGIGVTVASNPVSGIAVGALVAVSTGMAVLFMSWLNSPVDIVRAVSPETTLRNDRVGTFVTGPLAGAVLGTLIGLRAGLAIGSAAGVALGLAGGLVMTSWGWFTVTRYYLAFRRRLPLRLMEFLADAHRRGILRQAGAVYQFRHRRLQERLAADG